MLLRLVAALAATAFVFAGCSAEPVPDAEKIRIDSSSSPLGPSAGSGKAPKEEKSRAPRSKRVMLTADAAGVAVSVPAGWQVFSKTYINSAAGAERLAAVAEQLNLSVADYKAMIDAVDLFLSDGAGDAITVGPFAGPMPSKSDFEKQFGGVAATVEADSIATPLGEARLYHYRFSAGGIEQGGATAYVENGDIVVEITGGGVDGQRATEGLRALLKTLKRA